MEIGQFLRSRPQAVGLALLIPVVAGLVTFLVLALQPARYTATATVSVPSGAADSASRVGIFVANFTEVATSEDVLARVADATDVPRAELQDGLEVARLGQSSLFDVTYTGQRQDAVEPVVREVIGTTFGDLVQVSGADATLEAATEAYQDAVAARTAYQDEIGTLQPDRDYADISARIRSLEIDQPWSTALLNRLRTDRDALVPQIRRMEELDSAVEEASSRLDAAEQAAASALRDAAESQSSNTIQDLTVTEESSTGRIVQGVGVAAVAGLLVGLAVLVLPEVVGRRPAPSSTVLAEAAPTRHTLARGARSAS